MERSVGQRAAPNGSGPGEMVHVNQVGYLPDEPKRAVVPVTKPLASQTFHVVEEKTGVPRYSGELTAASRANSTARDTPGSRISVHCGVLDGIDCGSRTVRSRLPSPSAPRSTRICFP